MIKTTWPQRLTWYRNTTILSTILLLAACSSDSLGTTTISDDPLWTLTLSVHSVVMSSKAPDNTLQLHTVLKTASGRIVEPETPVRYSIIDPALQITEEGLLTALTTTIASPVAVEYMSTQEKIRLVDTVFVTVTEETPTSPLHTFSLQLPAGATNRLPVSGGSGMVSGTQRLEVVATNEAGDDITSQLSIRYHSSDPDVAPVDATSGIVQALVPNREVMIYATTTYYGVTRVDSLRMVIESPQDIVIQFQKVWSSKKRDSVYVFTPAVVTTDTGTTVMFFPERGGLPFDVQFDNPSAAEPSLAPWVNGVFPRNGTGNIETLETPLSADGLLLCLIGAARCSEVRSFFHVGTYPYHDSRTGASGTIIIKHP